jgi:hypothetical protein
MDRQKLAWHEAAHYCVARAAGARGVRAELRGDDGVTFQEGVVDPRDMIAILVAGGIAEEMVWGPSGTEGYGSDDDKRMIRAVLAGLHPECWSQRLAEGERIARDVLERSDLLEGVAERLWLTGHFP